MHLIVKWAVNFVALLVVVNMIPGTAVTNWTTLIVAALVLGLINIFLKPIILLLTLPINIVTLGLFTLIINTGLFYLTAMLVKGFTITGFWAAFWGAFVFSLISLLLNTF
ncbi:MAG: phage holin family protein, partial [Candidatus Margulisiibacteriota bacterium]